MSDKSSENAKLKIVNNDIDYNIAEGTFGPDVIVISNNFQLLSPGFDI